jgi:hypothetical protein
VAAQHWQRLLSFPFIGLNFEPLFSFYWAQFAALSFFLMGSISNPSFFFMGLVLVQHLHTSWRARFWCPMNLRCIVPYDFLTKQNLYGGLVNDSME